MKRLCVFILLVISFSITVGLPAHAQPVTILLSGDFESGLVPWQGKHLLPDDQRKCDFAGCYFEWAKSTTKNSRTLWTSLPYTGSAGQLLGVTGEFKVDPGATLAVRVIIPGQKTRCQYSVPPAAATVALGFTCASLTTGPYPKIRVKISSKGGGVIRADNLVIALFAQ